MFGHSKFKSLLYTPTKGFSIGTFCIIRNICFLFITTMFHEFRTMFCLYCFHSEIRFELWSNLRDALCTPRGPKTYRIAACLRLFLSVTSWTLHLTCVTHCAKMYSFVLFFKAFGSGCREEPEYRFSSPPPPSTPAPKWVSNFEWFWSSFRTNSNELVPVLARQLCLHPCRVISRQCWGYG